MDSSGSSTFTSYEKIAETPDQWHLDVADYHQLEKLRWVVTEKIHGANFCFILDGITIACANRKHILGKDDDFFHYQILLEKLRNKVEQVNTLVKKNYPQTKRVFLYGELFGGYYPHPDVQPDPSVQPVQTGIYYSPTIEFCAFDIAIEQIDHQRIYIDYEKLLEICKAVQLLYAAPLFIGKYTEALAYPIGFRSTLPALLNLPPLAEANKAEGIVIKPLKALFIETRKGPVRPVVKKKIPEFIEDKRFNLAQKWSPQQLPSIQNRLELLTWEAFNLITENRLQSAISKIGAINGAKGGNANRIFHLFVEDVLEQLAENQCELFASITAFEMRKLTLSIQEAVRTVLKDYARKHP